MIQLLEKERNQLRDLLQATSDIIEDFKNRRSIVSFDLYPITIINDGLAKWHNVAGFHVGFIVKLTKKKTRRLMKEVREWLRSRSKDGVHDPTWWESYKLNWHVSGEITDQNGHHKFWVELRLKRRW